MATTEGRGPEQRPLWKRLAWLVVLWGGSVAALSAVAYGVRLLMNAAGLVAP